MQADPSEVGRELAPGELASARPRGAPPAWNVVVTVHERGYGRARRLLGRLGKVRRTGFRNVLVVTVREPSAFPERLAALAESEPDVVRAVCRAVPATETFDFCSRDEFVRKCGAWLRAHAPELAGASFHVRMRRRGLRDELGSKQELERALAGIALEELGVPPQPGRISFADSDAVVAIETVGRRVGCSIWTRGEIRRYPFLRVD
jgi:tRNA(Ser,Leu) C12 N-acetylase TAN1